MSQPHFTAAISSDKTFRQTSLCLQIACESSAADRRSSVCDSNHQPKACVYRTKKKRPTQARIHRNQRAAVPKPTTKMASPSPSAEEDLQVTPRLCHLVKWPDFEGYGFNLHAEKSRPGQFVGAVDPGSPAELAGLRPGDRIVEVNGVNVSHENHRQVVERIKAVERETRLLVLDPEADRKCREKKVVVKSTMPGVVVIKTPVPRSQDPPNYLNVEPPQQNGKANGEEVVPAANGKHEKTPEEKSSPVPAPKIDTPPPSKTKEEIVTSRSSTPSIPDSPRSTKSSSSSGVASNGVPAHSATPVQGGGLNLNMSASEMRQMLANRRKKDPKKEHMDIRQKYDIIQQM